MGSFDFVTFFFFVAAVIIFIQLRSVLGKRTGHERPPQEHMARRDHTATPEGIGRSESCHIAAARPGERRAGCMFAAVDAYAEPGSELNGSA
jgi:predicted lipid-binding transport protein (Tim44 family)